MSLLDAFSMDGQVAVVSGAGSAMGESIASILARAGARVVAGDRNAAAAHSTAARIAAAGGSAVAAECAVSEQADCARLVAVALSAFGEITVLVNAAGDVALHPGMDGHDDLVRTFERELFGVYRLCELCAQEIEVAGGGAILNVAAARTRGAPDVMRSVAGSALHRLTRELGREWGPRGVRVNAIAPGAMGGRSHAFRLATGCGEDATRCRNPLRRLGEPADVGYAALFLCSYAADWISGEVLAVDGGSRLPG